MPSHGGLLLKSEGYPGHSSMHSQSVQLGQASKGGAGNAREGVTTKISACCDGSEGHKI